MLLFLRTLFPMFIAEMGDKTQLLLVAMASRCRPRHIVAGTALAIAVLNALAVALGAVVSTYIPPVAVKLAAGIAFFGFALSALRHAPEESSRDACRDQHPVLSVFGTFFLAELGDKTQLTAIAFAANAGSVANAVVVWLACSLGLFAADMIGMFVGFYANSRIPEEWMRALSFVIFAAFGIVTVTQGAQLLPLPRAGQMTFSVLLCLLFAASSMLLFAKRQRKTPQ